MFRGLVDVYKIQVKNVKNKKEAETEVLGESQTEENAEQAKAGAEIEVLEEASKAENNAEDSVRSAEHEI